MAQSNEIQNGAVSASPTPDDIRKWYEENRDKLKSFDAASNAIKALRDKDQVVVKHTSVFDKRELVKFMKNPSSYEVKLRNLAWFLFYRSHILQRIILYYATLVCLEARVVIPPYDILGKNKDESILKSYANTLSVINKWNIENEFFKVIVRCLTQDVFYGVAYYNKDGLYLLPLPEDYCRITAQYPQGDWQYAFDMQFFASNNRWLVDVWGEPFVSMWREYEKDRRVNRWQIMPPKYSCCMKFRNYAHDDIIPPFAGLFEDVISLLNSADLASIADEQDIYKLVWYELETLTGAKMPDEWKVDPTTSVEYFNRLISEALPEYASAALVPGKLNVIDFSDNDKTKESSKVLNATKTLTNTSGGGQLLNASTLSGTTAIKMACKADAEFVLSSMLPQISGWFARILPFVIKNPSTVHFYRVGRMGLDELRDQLLQDAQYGLPTKLSIMAINGIDQLQVLSLNHLEEDILNLADRFDSPLSSSFTSSGNTEGGRPTSDDGDLTDDGEASRDKSDRA